MGIALQTRIPTSSRTVNNQTLGKHFARQKSEDDRTAIFAFPQAYVNDNFALKTEGVFRLRNHISAPTSGASGLLLTEMTQLRPFSKMILSSGALRMKALPNAGGSSLKSEVLSYELLKRCYGAELRHTEMEVQYFPSGGPIIDYTCKMFDKNVAVSVTRAMKFYGRFTEEDATHLLVKKLSGVVASTRNAMEKWEKQMLHVWTGSFRAAMQIAEAYFHLRSDELKRNTLVLITVASSAKDIFTNTN